MEIVYAKTSAQVNTGGRPVLVRQGSHWRADDPVVQEYPSIFSDDPRFGLTTSVRFPDDDIIEQATSAPGERRQLSGRRS